MKLIDADKFLSYLIFSKHIDSLTCGEVKEAIEMCEVDVLDKIRAEIANLDNLNPTYLSDGRYTIDKTKVLRIIDKYKADSEDKIKEELDICGEESEEQLKKLKKLKAEIEKLKAELDYAKFRCTLPTIMDMMHNN